MTNYIQTVRSKAIEGREAEYRDWYVNTHIPAVLSLDGFVSAEFHERVSSDAGQVEFLCIYRIETTDLEATQQAMFSAGATMVPSAAMDVPATQVEIFVSVNA